MGLGGCGEAGCFLGVGSAVGQRTGMDWSVLRDSGFQQAIRVLGLLRLELSGGQSLWRLSGG